MFGKVSTLDKILFARNLAVMINSGMSLKEGVSAILQQTKSSKFKRILAGIIESLENGESLNTSLSKYPKVFSKLFIHMVRVGEEGGTLQENLEYQAVQMEKIFNLTQETKTAMIYPLIVVVAMFGLGALFISIVLPKLIPLFEGLEIQLPLATRILIGISNIVKSHGIFILLAIITLIVLFIYISRIPVIRNFNHTIMVKSPLLGPLVKHVNLARFTRILGSLVKSGTPIVYALEITASSIENRVYRKAIREMAFRVRAGATIGTYLRTRPDIFPATVLKMVEVGERSGTLEDSLLSLADFYERQIDRAIKRFSSTFEPLILVVLGIMVGFIALAIILPIYGTIGQLR